MPTFNSIIPSYFYITQFHDWRKIMKILNTFTLTILSGLVLSACSGGSGQSTPKPMHSPLNTIKQPHKPAKVQPTKPVDIQVEKPVENQFDNKTIFNTFNQNGGNFESGQWLSLKIDNQTIEVVTIKPNTEFVNKKSEGLFDKEGRLLGYYGYASLTHIKTDPHRPDEKFPEHLTFAMLEMDPSQKIRPTNDISYEGKFHYYYKDTPVKSLEGQIAAQYKKQNKELKMELFGEQKEYWVLKTNARKDGVSVSDEGNVFGQVYSNEKQPNATFDGAIYGKNGEVLAGTLDYDDYNNKENSWKGVVGAKAK